MKLIFHKYHGTGNDFILIDDRKKNFPEDVTLIRQLCHRHFGIGADGLILIRHHSEYDFEMVYYNADGSQSMCGNGSRCAVLFAGKLGLAGSETNFLSTDGPHFAILEGDVVAVQLHDVKSVTDHGDTMFINTGSPHHIEFVKSVEVLQVQAKGKAIRYSQEYEPVGTNVNFVELLKDNAIFVRTYERGVEAETLSCGTGVTACSVAAFFKGYKSPVKVHTLGGDLEVSFVHSNNHFEKVFLKGTATFVYEGQIEVA